MRVICVSLAVSGHVQKTAAEINAKPAAHPGGFGNPGVCGMMKRDQAEEISMKRDSIIMAVGLVLATATAAQAEDFGMRVIGGSVQLGADLVLRITGEDVALPEGARCTVELPPPYDAHVQQASQECRRVVLHQSTMPILDAEGYAIPSGQAPAIISVSGPDGAPLGEIDTVYPYNNQFSDLRILIRGVRNPVAEGQSFEAEVQGTGQPIAPGLTCRWATYGPVRFEPASDNHCTGRVTALAPTGRDANMHVEIVNMTDMHAVGYAIAAMIVE